MKATPFIKGWMYIPDALVRDPKALKTTLTVTPKAYKNYDAPKPIRVYDTGLPGYIGVPIDWGFHFLPKKYAIDDRTSHGFPMGPCPLKIDPHHPNAPDGQAEFMDQLEVSARANHTTLAVAGTGCGKTIAALELGVRLGRTMIVCVHLKRLMKQWVAEIKEKLGLTDAEIGTVQGAKCDYKGKKIVVAMMKSLCLRRYDDEFYDYFGYAVWDEVHRTGTALLSGTIGLFSAAVKLALTATAKRKDEAHQVYWHYFGGIKVTSLQTPMPATIHRINYRTLAPIWGEDRMTRISCAIKDRRRNRMLVWHIMKMYNDGRHILAISDRVDHVELIIDMLRKEGVPKQDLGQFTDQYNDPETGKRRKTTDEYIDWVKKVPRITVATYGAVGDGIDVPRWDAGIDLTPQSLFMQVLGRTRRRRPGKRPTVWYTPVDLAIGSFVGYYKARLRDVSGDPNVKVAA